MARRGITKKISHVRWKALTGIAANLSVGSAGIVALAATEFAETVMRTRGELLVWLDAVQSPGSWVRWGFGLVCVPEGTGTTVIWSPLTDANAPWFAYASGHLAYEEYVTDVVAAQQVQAHRRIIDSKAMRKCPPDMEVQAVFENVTVGNASDINFAFVGRLLMGR